MKGFIVNTSDLASLTNMIIHFFDIWLANLILRFKTQSDKNQPVQFDPINLMNNSPSPASIYPKTAKINTEAVVLKATINKRQEYWITQ